MSTEQSPEPNDTPISAGLPTDYLTMNAIDSLVAYLENNDQELGVLEAGGPSESVLAIHGFARAYAKQRANDLMVPLRAIPDRLVRVHHGRYFDELAEAPAHRRRLIDDNIHAALRYRTSYSQVGITARLNADCRARSYGLEFRTTDLLVVYGAAIQTMFGRVANPTNQRR